MWKSANGMSIVEIVVIVVMFAACWSIFEPVYQKRVVLSDFQDGMEELSSLKQRTYESVSSKVECPNEVGRSFPGSHLFSDYSLTVAPVSFSHGCLIRAKFSSFAHRLLRDRMVELVGSQTSVGLLVWSCSATVDQAHLPPDCVHVPVVVFP